MKKLLPFLLLMLVACSPSQPYNESEEPVGSDDPEDIAPIYDPAVDWEICGSRESDHPCNIIAVDHNGNTFDLYSHYGSLIVLDLSTMWCGPCNQAGANAQNVQDQYASEDLIYATLLIENREGMSPSEADIQQWASDFGNTTSPVIPGDRTMLTSSGGSWELTSWPTFWYIDREMVIRDVDKGYASQEVIYSIEWLLTL
tara:strand:+ start:77 stop:676 length:600 start_codon:yes stop_codon:yes gene_type:complete